MADQTGSRSAGSATINPSTVAQNAAKWQPRPPGARGFSAAAATARSCKERPRDDGPRCYARGLSASAFAARVAESDYVRISYLTSRNAPNVPGARQERACLAIEIDQHRRFGELDLFATAATMAGLGVVRVAADKASRFRLDRSYCVTAAPASQRNLYVVTAVRSRDSTSAVYAIAAFLTTRWTPC